MVRVSVRVGVRVRVRVRVRARVGARVRVGLGSVTVILCRPVHIGSRNT